MLACVWYHTLVPGWVMFAICAVLVMVTRSWSGPLAGGAMLLGGAFMTSVAAPLFGWGLGLLVALLTLASVRLQRERPPGARWAGPLVLLCWIVPVGLLVLWACGVPPMVAESCTVCSSNLKNLATAVETWSTDHDKRYPGSLEELVPEYIKPLPTCPGPLAGNPRARVFYRALGVELADGYGYRRQGDSYVLWCRTRGTTSHTGDHQPWYSGVSGLRNECWFTGEGDRRSELGKGPP